MSKVKICTHCKDEFKKDAGEKIKGNYFCGYCVAVVFGDDGDFAKWPPKVGGQEYKELKKWRGAQTTDEP